MHSTSASHPQHPHLVVVRGRHETMFFFPFLCFLFFVYHFPGIRCLNKTEEEGIGKTTKKKLLCFFVVLGSRFFLRLGNLDLRFLILFPCLLATLSLSLSLFLFGFDRLTISSNAECPPHEQCSPALARPLSSCYTLAFPCPYKPEVTTVIMPFHPFLFLFLS